VPVARRVYVAARRGGLERPAIRAMVDALREAAARTGPLPSTRG
jgi:DNA-binding transcriptional LysR family regulator